jgi:two-component system, OmpR family, phosphate regulon sensor histidine kinase PhoR
LSLAERLVRLGETLIALSGSPVPTHLFQTLADHGSRAVPGDYLGVCLSGPDGGGYRAHSLAALDLDGAAARLFGPGEGLPGRAMTTGRPAATDDLGAERGDLERALVRAGLRAALAVPIHRGLETLGALFFARADAPYAPDDVQVATLLAAGVAGALETSRLYQALADERSTLAAVLGSTQDAVLMVSEEDVVVLANPAVRSMLGLVPEGMTGRPVSAVEHLPLRRLLEERRAGVTELLLPDGRTAQASVVPVITGYGESIGLAAVLRDITLLKELEQMKSDFVNTVSHDLKNPITVIAGTADLLLQRPDEARYRERCERIKQVSKYMTDLVTDLLDLGKVEAGLDTPREPIDLAALIGESMTMVKHDAETKRQRVGVTLPAALPVVGDRERLKQALLNLIGNAVKYTPAGGVVQVSAVVDGARTVTVVVKDNGIGISARDLPHVFDKFYRVRSAATKDIPGTGLGLAITRSIIEAHQGRVAVESVEGEGSAFSLTLPLNGT